MKKKKKSLVEDSGPTDLDKGRTMGKSDLAISRPNESRTCIFTNTAIPRFDGTRCWEQHLLVFQAIVKSNGWSSVTAALQLVAHLDGEALQVALLVLSRNREGWREIADELLAYYNTPGRLAVFHRRFENAHRRPASDPAMFGIGYTGISRIFRHDREGPRPNGARQIHRVSRELRLTSALRWCCARDVNPRHCRQLPCVGKSRRDGRHRR